MTSVTPEPKPDPTPEGLSAEEVKGIVGSAIDDKLGAISSAFATKDDMEATRAGILEDIVSKLPSLIPAASSVDEESLIKKVEGLLDGKLAGIGENASRKVGSLGRWLQGEK